MVVNMRNYIKYTGCIFLQLFIAIGLSSCNNDDDIATFPQADITGEWFMDFSDASKVNFVNITLTPDGYYSDREVNIGLNSNYDMLVEGTYKYDGKIRLSTTSKYDPRRYYQVWKINNVSKYTLDVTDETIYDSYVFHRVVTTYKMNVGDIKQWNISDAGFTALSFFSCDDKIASVDESGMIRANKRGTVFVRGVSGTDEAVIKVVVDDSNNLMDNLVQYVGRDFDNVVSYYGTPALQFVNQNNGMTMASFNLFDDYLKDVAVSYRVKNHIYMVMANFRDRADINPIIDYYDANYDQLSVTENYYHRYLIEQDDSYVIVLIDEMDRTFTCVWNPGALDEYDGMITANVDDFCKWFDFDLSEAVGGYYTVVIDNPAYIGFTMFYNEESRNIEIIQFTCKKGINESAVRAWFDEHYKTYEGTNGLNYYISGNTFIRSEYYVGISTNPSTGRVNVAYIRNSKM